MTQNLDEKILPCTKKICTITECCKICSGIVKIAVIPKKGIVQDTPEEKFGVNYLSYSFAPSTINFCIWQEIGKKLHIIQRFSMRADRFQQIIGVARFYSKTQAEYLLAKGV